MTLVGHRIRIAPDRNKKVGDSRKDFCLSFPYFFGHPMNGLSSALLRYLVPTPPRKSAPRAFSTSLLFALLSLMKLFGAGSDASGLMDISDDGTLLACTNRDSGTVTVVDLRTISKRFEVPVGTKPEGLTFLGDSHRLATAVYADDKVVFLNADSGKVDGSTQVYDEPYGVVSNASGSRVYVTLEYPGQVIEVDCSTRSILRSMAAGSFPRGLALTAGGKLLLVTEYYTAQVRALDVEAGREVMHWPGRKTDNLARQIVVHPSRPKAYLSHIRSRTVAAHGEGSIFPYVTVIDLPKDDATKETSASRSVENDERKRFPMDAFRGNFVVANPWDIALAPDGKQLYVVFSGTDDLFACNIIDDDYREITPRGYVELGHNPRAVRVAPDNKTVYVYNALDFNVVGYDTTSLKPTTTIAVTKNPLGKEILAGKILFYSALQPMVGRRWISCSSCHPDGDPDSRTWTNPEGLRATPPLFGLAWTHPLHWSADRDETQDFEHTIRSLLMQGHGLIEGKVNPSLEKPNKGISPRLDALAAYTNSHKFTLSPHAKGGLTDAAQRGKTLFFSQTVGCSKCHSGPFYTDSKPGDHLVRHDVGTGNDDLGEKMGPAYDTPTLLGIYRTAPYLHHGKAPTLTDVLRSQNAGDRHGKTSHLSDDDIADLVEFLKALPYVDPEPLAAEASLTKVDG